MLAPLAIAATAVQAGAGLMGADATYRAGRAEKRQAFTQADMEEQATRQADMEAREQIRRARIDQRREAGATRAAFAGSGVVGTVGSPIDILGRQAALQELHIQDMARAASTAYSSGFARAKQLRVSGKAALAGAKRASYGQLLSTGANVAGTTVSNIDKGIFKPRSLMPA